MYLKTKIEKQVNRLQEQASQKQKKKIEIAYIHLAYDNQELIKLLLKRGKLLKEAKLTKYKDVENQINELLSKPENKDKFRRPVCAFVIFNQEEGLNLVQKLCTSKINKCGKIQLNRSGKTLKVLDKDAEIQRAAEPSDIIWENLANCAKQISIKEIFVTTISFAVLILICWFFFQMNLKNLHWSKRYPQWTDCI